MTSVDRTAIKSPADMARLRAALEEQALALGFDCIGITAPGTIEAAGKYFLEFIASGGHGDMDFSGIITSL